MAKQKHTQAQLEGKLSKQTQVSFTFFFNNSKIHESKKQRQITLSQKLRTLKSHSKRPNTYSCFLQAVISLTKKMVRFELNWYSSHIQPGAIYGTLSMCAKYSHARYGTAINSVLRNSLKKVVIVQTRDVAQQVISYFREHQIGMVSCEILDDILETTDANEPSTWLPNLLIYKDPLFKKVFSKLFGYRHEFLR